MLTKTNICSEENTVCNCCRNIEHFLFCIRPFALHRQQPEKDKQNVDFAPPWKNICGRPCQQRLSTEAKILK